jgi:CheY-like chemotaxis protein
MVLTILGWCTWVPSGAFRVIQFWRRPIGREALEVALNYSPASIDLLLTDMVMPHMGGRELVSHFTDVYHQTRVMYISGYAEDDESVGGSQDRLSLQKPFTPAELLLKVREALS